MSLFCTTKKKKTQTLKCFFFCGAEHIFKSRVTRGLTAMEWKKKPQPVEQFSFLPIRVCYLFTTVYSRCESSNFFLVKYRCKFVIIQQWL